MQKSEMVCKLTPEILGVVRIIRGMPVQTSEPLSLRRANSADVIFLFEKGLRTIKGRISKQMRAFTVNGWVSMFSVERSHPQPCIFSIQLEQRRGVLNPSLAYFSQGMRNDSSCSRRLCLGHRVHANVSEVRAPSQRKPRYFLTNFD